MPKRNAAQEARLRFIDFTVHHYGTLRRAALEDYFGIATAQASLDLKAYMEVAPLNLVYDGQAKLYRRTVAFERKFP